MIIYPKDGCVNDVNKHIKIFSMRSKAYYSSKFIFDLGINLTKQSQLKVYLLGWSRTFSRITLCSLMDRVFSVFAQFFMAINVFARKLDTPV